MTERVATPRARRQPRLDEEGAAGEVRGHKHVWVFMEMERGVVHPVSFELLGEGRKLADKLGVELAGVVMGAPGEEVKHAARGSFRLWRGTRLPGRKSGAGRLPQRALFQGPDPAGQRAQAGNPAARRHHARPRSRGIGGHDAADRPHRRLHRIARRRRQVARRDAPDLRRLAALHHLYAELSPTDGDGASARHAHAGTPGRSRRPRRPLRHRHGGIRHHHENPGFLPDRDFNKSNLAFADVVVAGGMGLQARKISSWSRISPRCSARNSALRVR